MRHEGVHREKITTTERQLSFCHETESFCTQSLVTPQKSISFSWKSFLSQRFRRHFSRARRTALSALLMFVNFLFLPLTIKALEILKCQTIADGTSYLVAEPSLSCDDEWHRIGSAIGLLLLFVYSIGLLMLYTLIFLKLRPPHHALPIFGFNQDEVVQRI